MAAVLCYEILDHVNANCEIEFGLSKETDTIRHTAIALSFDQVPLFTLDFYPKDDERLLTRLTGSSTASAGAFVALATGSDIYINNFCISTTNIESRILGFAIDTVTGKNRAIKLLKDLAAIDMGEYNTFSHNCCDFASKAIAVLTQNKEQFDRGTGSDESSQHNPQKDATGIILFGAAAIAASFGLYKTLSKK